MSLGQAAPSGTKLCIQADGFLRQFLRLGVHLGPQVCVILRLGLQKRHEGQGRMPAGELRVQCNRPLSAALCCGEVGRRGRNALRPASNVGVIGLNVRHIGAFGSCKAGGKLSHNALCDLILNGKDVVDLSVKPLCPNLFLAGHFREAHGEADLIPCPPQRAIEGIVHAQGIADPRGGHVVLSKAVGGSGGHHA